MGPLRRVAASAGTGVAGAPKVVLLVGEGREWPPELESFLTREGYVTDRLAELDAVAPVLENTAVRALLVVARPLGASDLLILRRIREASPQTGIVVVTRTPTSPDLKRAFESGATAFLSWPASTEALRQAVESGGVASSPGARLRP
jgi:DNA-binding NtrC family response regulator